MGPLGSENVSEIDFRKILSILYYSIITPPTSRSNFSKKKYFFAKLNFLGNVPSLKTPNPEGELQTPSDKKDTPFGKGHLDSVQGVLEYSQHRDIRHHK